MNTPFSLKDKTILVTGAASGIGKETSLLCAELGANMILIDVNGDKLADTAKSIQNGRNQIFAFDLTDYDALCDVVSQMPKLDGIASNAGIVKTLLAKFNEKDDMEKIFKINTFSHINLVQELIKQKRLNKGASIVFTSSMSGVFCGIAGGSLYGATKAALLGYSKALAIELAPRGIRVNTIHPGMIETPLTQSTSLSSEVFNEDIKRYPLGRYGKPYDIACAIAYLLSDATIWMTGTKLLIDGGYSLK